MNDSGVCCGCGVCAGVCPASSIQMEWDGSGGLRTGVKENCLSCGLCGRVCPFENNPVGDRALKDRLFKGSPMAFRGFCKELRGASASGGLATRFLQRLLESGAADHIVCAGRQGDSFGFRVVSCVTELPGCSGSVYYPMELSGAIRHILRKEGRYAVVGLPCQIKALRKAAGQLPKLSQRVTVYAGLVCGRQMSAHFTEYLKLSAGIPPGAGCRITYHAHDGVSPASDYCAKIEYAGTVHEIHSSGEVYETGWAYFGLDACRYCDDVFAEYADVVFMDAWLPEYRNEKLGTSIVLLRRPDLAEYFTSLPDVLPARAEDAAAAQTGSRVLPDKTERAPIRALFAGKLRKLPLKSRRIGALRLLLEGIPILIDAGIRRLVRRGFKKAVHGKIPFRRFYRKLRFFHRLKRILSLPFAALYYCRHR